MALGDSLGLIYFADDLVEELPLPLQIAGSRTKHAVQYISHCSYPRIPLRSLAQCNYLAAFEFVFRNFANIYLDNRTGRANVFGQPQGQVIKNKVNKEREA